MSKKSKKRHKNKNVNNKEHVDHSDVLVAPTVARATDKSNSWDDDYINNAEVAHVPETPKVEHLDANEVDNIKTIETGDTSGDSPKASASSEKKPLGNHGHHSHVHQTCQSPQLLKKVKNLTSLLIIASGFAAGTIFIDVAQFFTQRGLSARALNEARIVRYDGATWVKYDEPKVSVDVFTSTSNSPETMEQIEGLLSALSYSIPTLEARIVDADSDAGARRAKDLDIAYAPAMHFSASLSESPYYKASSDIFKAKSDGTYLLQMDVMDIKIDHFLEAPQDDVGMVIGMSDAPHQVVMFENFLCEGCADIHNTLSAFQSANPETLKIVYKNIPDALQEASKDAAIAGHCAYAQGLYEQYSKILFTNSAWKSVEGDLRSNLFARYAGFLPGLDVEEMRSCYASREYEGQLVVDITEANRLGIVNVPTVFVDGRVLLEADDGDLLDALDSALDVILTQERG